MLPTFLFYLLVMFLAAGATGSAVGMGWIVMLLSGSWFYSFLSAASTFLAQFLPVLFLGRWFKQRNFFPGDTIA